MGGLLIRGLSQTSLYRLQIKEIIVFAPHHIGEPSQIYDNRAIPILPVQACAAVRGLISPVQPGRTRKEVLESPCLPGTERRKGT